MSLPEFAPPLTAPDALPATLRRQGYAVADSLFTHALAAADTQVLGALAREWDELPTDPYLKDGGHYRRRRHASYVVHAERCERVTHRAHFQPPQYNALHGGMRRWFSPIEPALEEAPAFGRLLLGLGALFTRLKPAVATSRDDAERGQRWYVEAHQFRIGTDDGIGRPTPEGAHRDGVDFVALFLIARSHIRGGETRVFDAHRPEGLRFTLSEPWSVLILDDERVIHETTPIQPDGESVDKPHRDTLVLTYRREGFQDP
ncbi:MAG: 2OG-Fe dioxygenase family protein [Myxococcales bacterium]